MTPVSLHPFNAQEYRIAVGNPEDGHPVLLEQLPPGDPRGVWYMDRDTNTIWAQPDPAKRKLYLTIMNGTNGSVVCIGQASGGDDQRWNWSDGVNLIFSVAYPESCITVNGCDPDSPNPVVIHGRGAECQEWVAKPA